MTKIPDPEQRRYLRLIGAKYREIIRKEQGVALSRAQLRHMVVTARKMGISNKEIGKEAHMSVGQVAKVGIAEETGQSYHRRTG